MCGMRRPTAKPLQMWPGWQASTNSGPDVHASSDKDPGQLWRAASRTPDQRRPQPIQAVPLTTLPYVDIRI